MRRWSAATVVGEGIAAVSARLAAVLGPTETDSPVALVIVPSATVIEAVSALYRDRKRVVEGKRVDPRGRRIIEKKTPKLVPTPKLLFTVGTWVPIVLAPAKVRLLVPV